MARQKIRDKKEDFFSDANIKHVADISGYSVVEEDITYPSADFWPGVSEWVLSFLQNSIFRYRKQAEKQGGQKSAMGYITPFQTLSQDEYIAAKDNKKNHIKD